MPPRVRPRLLLPPLRLGRGSVLLLSSRRRRRICIGDDASRRRRRSIRAQNAARIDRVALCGRNVDRRVVPRGTRENRGTVPRSRVVLGRVTFVKTKVNTLLIYTTRSIAFESGTEESHQRWRTIIHGDDCVRPTTQERRLFVFFFFFPSSTTTTTTNQSVMSYAIIRVFEWGAILGTFIKRNNHPDL